MFGVCWGRNRLAPQETVRTRTLSVMITLGTGIAQLASVWFFLVGWFWSIAWGLLLVSVAGELTAITVQSGYVSRQKVLKYSEVCCELVQKIPELYLYMFEYLQEIIFNPIVLIERGTSEIMLFVCPTRGHGRRHIYIGLSIAMYNWWIVFKL